MNPTLLFCCGAALSLVSATAGAFGAAWFIHVGRTGVSPMPKAPKMSLFSRRPAEGNGEAQQQSRPARVGP